MALIWLLSSMGIASVVLFVLGAIVFEKFEEGLGYFIAGCGVFLLALAVLLAPITLFSFYNESLSLPARITRQQETVDQYRELYTGELSIGGGMEAIEYRKVLMEAIQKLNDMKARADYINVSPWFPWKVEYGS